VVLSLSLYTSPPLLGNMDGRFFFGAFLLENFFIRSFRDMHIPCRRVSVSIADPLGNLEGVRLLGLSREEKYIWAPFLDPEIIKILSLGATAPMIRYGAQRA